MAGLALGSRAENGSNVVIALDIGFGGKVQVPAVGLGLTGKRIFKFCSVWVFLSDMVSSMG